MCERATMGNQGGFSVKLEDQVVSLELAKRLKELGVKQESCFVWWTHPLTGFEEVLYRPKAECDGTVECAAFTVAELAGWFIENGKRFQITLTGANFYCKNSGHHADKYMANAMAKNIIYLIEQKLVTP